MMIGMVLVACLAARVGVGPAVMMQSTLRRASSAASSGSRSTFPSADRYSMAMFLLSISQAPAALGGRPPAAVTGRKERRSKGNLSVELLPTAAHRLKSRAPTAERPAQDRKIYHSRVRPHPNPLPKGEGKKSARFEINQRQAILDDRFNSKPETRNSKLILIFPSKPARASRRMRAALPCCLPWSQPRQRDRTQAESLHPKTIQLLFGSLP